jgi:thiol:disulfide interchange protein
MAAGAIALIAIGTNGAKSHPAEASVATEAEPYSTSRLQQLRADDRAVFVNMTAAWCITCKVNERVALSGEDFVATLKSNDIVYLQGDWTNKNAEITRFLEDFGRAGVPLYVLFPKSGGDPVVLPQILDPGALKRALSNVS